MARLEAWTDGRIPAEVIAISESGLRTSEDLARLRQLGYRAFLIGERFMSAEDPGEALKGLVDGCITTEDTKDTKDTKEKTIRVRT